MLSKKELELRKHTIGSSDVPAILGISPFKDQAGVLKAKLLDQGGDIGLPGILGHNLEEPIAKTALQTGAISGVTLFGGWTVKRGWRTATPDFYLLKTGNMEYAKRRPLTEEEAELIEVKNVSTWKAEDWEWGKKCPKYVRAQCQWQMLVLKHSVVTVVALIAGYKLATFRIERNEKWIAKMDAVCSEFWQQHLSPENRDKMVKARIKHLTLESRHAYMLKRAKFSQQAKLAA